MFLATSLAGPTRFALPLALALTSLAAALALAGCSGAGGPAAAPDPSPTLAPYPSPDTSLTPPPDPSPTVPPDPSPDPSPDPPSAPAQPAASAARPAAFAAPGAPHVVPASGFHEIRQCGADPVLQYRPTTPDAPLPPLAIVIAGQTRPLAQGRYVFQPGDRTPTGAVKPYVALVDGTPQPVVIDYLEPRAARCLADVPAPTFWNVRGPARGFTIPRDHQVSYQAIIGDVAEPVPETAPWVPVSEGFHPVRGETMVHLRAIATPGYELAYPTGWMQYFDAPRAMAAPIPHVLAGGAGTVMVHWERPDAAPPTTTYSVVVTDVTGGVRGKPVLRMQNEPRFACDVPVSLGRTIEIEVVASADAASQITRGTTTYPFAG